MRLAVALTASAFSFAACWPAPPADVRATELRELAIDSLAQISGAVEVADLAAPVEVRRDPWGVAHIYAQSQDDLFFAQGFVAAQDRLWQMDWWRRFGEGRLAEVLGPVALEHDRFARLLHYRGDLAAEYASYHPDGRQILEAFARGVNAYVAEAQASGRLPVEFRMTGIEPDPWTAETPLLRMAGLAMTGDNLREIDLALQVHESGAEAANRRMRPEPWRDLEIPEGLDVASIPRDFRAQVLGPTLPSAPPLLPRYEPWRDLWNPVAALVSGRMRPRSAVTPSERQSGEGSNNWVVGGRGTNTGMPLLANDPHRSVTLPSLRYLVHLNAPGWNVIGAGEPSLPGVAIGHNERIGWGLTIVGIDQGDIYVERLNPDNRDQVWHDGEWQNLDVVSETVHVRGESARELRLKFSHHGPILYEDHERNLAYSFRTVLSEPGTAGYLGSLRVDQAADWPGYVEAMRAWRVPSENMIYADVDGNIGWMAAGLAPRRQGSDGRLPVPGDGSREWRGFRDVAELPQEFNPERGYIATANQNIMPPGYDPPLGYRWSSPVRYQRIVDALERGDLLGVEDFQRLQLDVFSPVAARRVGTLKAFVFTEERVERARRRLVDWDAVLDTESAAAALYKAWEAACREAGIDPDAADAAGVQAALTSAIDELERTQGDDPERWRWGAGNRLEFPHVLADTFDLPAVERPGDGTTVNVAVRRHGASFREILDVADWDRSLVISAPGQSGQPESPYYRNLRRPWAAGQYFPMLFSREAVERSTAYLLLLLPAESP